jgi:hypothetical protein
MSTGQPRKRRWRRWLLWSCAAVVVARLLLALLLPWLLGLAAGAAGLTLDYRAAQLSLSGLCFRLDDLVVRDAAAGEAPPLLTAQELFVDVATWQLLRGQLVVVDAALTGATVHLVQDADGRLRLPAAWQGGGAEPAPPADVDEPSTPPRFESPLQVVSARVHDLRLVLEEAATSRQTGFSFGAEVADVGRTDRPGTITARVHSPGLLDDLRLAATVNLRGDEGSLTWQATLRGLRPASVPWLDDPAGAPTPHVFGGDLEGELHASTTPAAPLPALSATLRLRTSLDEQERLAVELRAGPSRLDGADWGLPLALTARGADLVDELRLDDGRLDVSADATRLAGALRAEGATLRLLAPWLASLGVTLPAPGLGLQAQLRATVQGDRLAAELTDVAIGTDSERLVLPRLALRDLQAVDGALRLGAVEVEGPQLAVTKAADGALELLGVRLGTPTATAAATATPATGPAAAAPFTWPRLALGKLTWTGVGLRFVDHSLGEPAELAVELDVHGERLALGQDAAPGQLTANVRIPGAIGALRAAIDLTPSHDALAVECQLTATQVTAQSLSPWLQRAGITSQLQDGRLRALLSAQLRSDAGGIAADAKVGNLRFEDGDEVLLGMRRLEGQGLTTAPALDLGAWTIDEPYVVVHRQADGSLGVLGLRLGSAPAATTTAPAAGAPSGPPATATPAPAPAPPALATAEPMQHGPIAVRGAVLRWIDASRAETADVSVGVDLNVERKPDDRRATTFRAELRVEPAVGALTVDGTLRRTADGGRVEAQLTGERLRGEGLRALLPPQLTCTLEQGLLRAGLAARWQLAPALSLTVAANGLSLEDRGEELLALDALDLQLPEVSPTRVHIATARVRGLRGIAASTAGGLHVFGMQFAPAPAGAPPVEPVAAGTPAPTAPRGASLPALRIDELDLQLERFLWQERGTTDGEPLLASARLRLAEPWATAAEPGATPPCRLLLEAAAAPLCRQLQIDAAIAPFALAPTIDLTVRATGIDTTALARVQPGLADQLTGTCTDAVFTTKVHGELDLRRRDPLRFDLSQPFGGELVFEAIDLAATDEGPSLLHVDEVAIHLRAFDPRTGDVLLRSIEVDGPRMVVENTADGLELLGLRLAPPAAAATPTVEASTPMASAPAPGGPAPEFAVDRLQVFGLAFDYADRTTEPPTVVPIEDTDLKVLNLSTRALAEPRMIAFTAAIRGGDVSLERRVLRSSVLAGLLGSAANALTGGNDEHEMETRPLLDEITVTGQVQPFPQPKGQVRAQVDRFELPALRGLAKAGGVDLADGVFDLDFEAQLQGAKGMQLQVRPKFTWLSLSEPPGGPLSTYLKLPAPLDTVLFALRNDDDEHVLPLQVQVPAEGIGSGAVAEAAVEALVRLIADAVASAAFRVTGMVTGAVGLGGTTDTSQLAATLEFVAGDPLPSGGTLEEVLAAVADDPELVVVLTHELGRGDLDRARELASPPAAIVAATVAELRAARAALERDRAPLAARVAALYGAGRMQDAWQQHHALRDLDDRLGALQRTQEEALRMSMGEDERAVRRRTRTAAETLALVRLETVRHRIRERLGAAAAARVEWRTPRGVETAGLPDGGRVMATVRRRAAR